MDSLEPHVIMREWDSLSPRPRALAPFVNLLRNRADADADGDSGLDAATATESDEDADADTDTDTPQK